MLAKTGKLRGIDADLGKVEAIAAEHIITKKGILSVFPSQKTC